MRKPVETAVIFCLFVLLVYAAVRAEADEPPANASAAYIEAGSTIIDLAQFVSEPDETGRYFVSQLRPTSQMCQLRKTLEVYDETDELRATYVTAYDVARINPSNILDPGGIILVFAVENEPAIRIEATFGDDMDEILPADSINIASFEAGPQVVAALQTMIGICTQPDEQ